MKIKNFPFILAIFIWNFCQAQNVQFKLFRTKACSAVELLDTNYYLSYNSGSIDSSFHPTNGITKLPHPGKYSLSFEDGPYIDTMIEVKEPGLFVFRFKEPEIGLYPVGLDIPFVYKNCGKLLNGFFESFYPDGKKYIRGNFSGGYVKDSIVTYYNNGVLKKKRIHLPKKTVIQTFDSLANRIKISSYQNGSIMNYRWSKSQEFFANGKIKLIESDVNRVTRLKEYFRNGHLKIKQTKKRRVEYNETGTKKIVYRWRKKLELFEPHDKGIHDYKIHKIEFDAKGQISEIICYEDWDESGSPPRLDPKQSNWIISLVKYKEGKVTENVKEIDIKNYIEK